jgi:hypothetical protein
MNVIKKEVVYKETHITLSVEEVKLLKQILYSFPDKETEDDLDTFAYNLYCNL